uniref:Serine carboxylase n=1 Tax=Bodo saltans TaxID=75058 RepID=B6DT83_BODSA|nr:serine carboxylase [Bodo saltans]
MRARQGSVYKDSVMALQWNAANSGWQRNMTVNYFEQLIDHSNAALGTFQQRWWGDLSAFTNQSEYAMLYINGEGEAHGSPDGYPAVYGRNISAAMFGLEHRYYGESMPAPLTNRSMLNYLTVENALADLEAFRLYLQATVLKKEVKWFICGGSYSGALSAWSKATYPASYLAAWSSSGVVNARFDYYAFDGHIVSVLPAVCEKAIRSVFDQFSAAYDDPTQRAAMMAIFGTPAYFTKEDMAWMLADGSAMAVQYGSKNYLCDSIVPLSKTNPFEQYATIIKALWGESFTSSCYYSTECLSNAQYSDQWAAAGYAWVYQCCSQLAYWQSGYPNSLRLDVITTDYYINQCRSAFGQNTFPDTYTFNAKFGGATPNATNVIALQGSDDPWQTAGVQAPLGPNYPEVLAQCNGCGHCGDLMSPLPTDPASLTAQREAIVNYLDLWLGRQQQQQVQLPKSKRNKFF